MLTKKLAAMFVPFFMTAAAPAFAQTAGATDTTEKTAKLGETFTVLHAVGQWATEISQLAETRAASPQVKEYAHRMATQNAANDEKLMALAQKQGIEVEPLNPQTEEGKSMLARIKGETELLSSLEGDAFDKEYMTLVTNTQQSVIHYLDAQKAAATSPDMKKVLGEMTTTVKARLTTAQSVMAKIYGNSI